MKKKFLFHTILYTVAPKLPSLASFFILPIITPYLSLKDYGKYGLVIACYSLFLMSVTLGQRVVLQNSFFEYETKYNRVWRRAYGIMSIGSLVGSLLMAIAFYFFLDENANKEYLLVTGICSFALICSPIETLAQVYYILREQPYAITLRSIIMSIFNIIISIITIKYLKLGYIGLVVGFASGSFFSLLFYLYPICIKHHIYPLIMFKRKHWNEYLKIGLPLLPHYLSLSIFNTSDRILLGFYKVNVSSIGLYSQGYGIGSNGMTFINGIFSAIGKTLQVSFRGQSEQDRRRIRSIFLLLIAGTGVFFFNISLWMREIYGFLFRKAELQIGYPVAILVLMAHIFFPLYNFAVYSLFIAKKTTIVAKITFAAAMVNLVLNLIFIPVYGIWASLVTTSFSFVFLSLIVLFIKDVQLELAWMFPKLNRVYFLCILYGIGITMLVWYLKDVNWALKLTVSLSSLVLTASAFFYRKFFFGMYYSVIRILK